MDINIVINLADVIASTLANQWNIQIVAINIAEQTGILQTAHGAFNLRGCCKLKNRFIFQFATAPFKSM